MENVNSVTKGMLKMSGPAREEMSNMKFYIFCKKIFLLFYVVREYFVLEIYIFRIYYLVRLINDFKSTDFVSKFHH